jgi:hypothetical protein
VDGFKTTIKPAIEEIIPSSPIVLGVIFTKPSEFNGISHKDS